MPYRLPLFAVLSCQVEWLPAVMLNVPILLVDVMLYGSIIYVMIG